MSSYLDKFRNKKIFAQSHADLDGIGSTTIGLYYIRPIALKYDTHNSNDYSCEDIGLETFKNYDIIIFTDFSPTESVVHFLNENEIDYLIFDHHISRKESLENLAGDKFIYDSTRCGCKIFFDTITKGLRVKNAIYQFVEYVSVYDLFQMQSNLWREARGLNNILWGMISWFSDLESTPKYQRFIDAMIYKFSFEKHFYLNDYEIGLMEKAEIKERDNYERAKKNLSVRKDGQGNIYGYFECTSKLSIVSNWILKERQELKYVICHSTFGDDKGIVPKVSIRSLDDRGIDCSVMASLFGCGGHKNAASVEFKNFEDFEKLRKGKMHLI